MNANSGAPIDGFDRTIGAANNTRVMRKQRSHHRLRLAAMLIGGGLLVQTTGATCGQSLAQIGADLTAGLLSSVTTSFVSGLISDWLELPNYSSLLGTGT